MRKAKIIIIINSFKVKKHFGQTFSPASCSQCIFKISHSPRPSVFYLCDLCNVRANAWDKCDIAATVCNKCYIAEISATLQWSLWCRICRSNLWGWTNVPYCFRRTASQELMRLKWQRDSSSGRGGCQSIMVEANVSIIFVEFNPPLSDVVVRTWLNSWLPALRKGNVAHFCSRLLHAISAMLQRSHATTVTFQQSHVTTVILQRSH